MSSLDALAPPTDTTFGELLDWHLQRGTRPPGSDKRGETWKKSAFAADTGVSDKQVRNWIANTSLPNDLATIERVLFGRDQKDYVTWRMGLRDALKNTRSSKAHIKKASTKPPPPSNVPIHVAPVRRNVQELLVKNIERGLAGIHFVRTRGRAVQLSASDEDVKSAVIKGKRLDAISFLNEWARDPHGQPRCALLGEHGMGKTITTMAFAQSLLKAREQEPTLPLPIYLDLRRVGDAAKGNLDLRQILELVLRKASDRDDSETALEAQEVIRLVREEGAIAIFDGLDEVLVHISAAAGQRFMHEIFWILPPSVWLPQRTPETPSGPGRVLVTCRANYFRTMRDQNRHLTAADRDDIRADDYRLFVLLPFTEGQIRDYLTHALPGEDTDKILDNIRTVYNLSALAERPYMLSLIVQHIPEIERWKLEGRRITGIDLYRHVVLSWLERDVGRHQLTPDHKQQLMEHLAAALWRSGNEAWTVNDVEQWLIDLFRAQPELAAHYEGKDRQLLKDDLRAATFLVRAGGANFRFVNTSLHEFFLASYMHRALRKNCLENWDLPLVSRETLDFLGQLLLADEDPMALETLRKMRDAYRLRVSEQAFDYVLFALGRGYPAPSAAGFCLDGADLRGWRIGEQPSDSQLVSAASIAVKSASERSQQLKLRGISFRHARLDSVLLRNVDADGAEFSGACLSRAEWIGGRARGARFVSADMSGVMFRNLDLEDANLTDVQFQHSRFLRCQLQNAYGLGAVGDAAFFALCEPAEQFVSPKATAARAAVLVGHSDAVHSCAFAPDGTRLISAAADGVLRLWNVASGECLAVLHGHDNEINGCAFAPDGQHFASAGDDGTLRIWDAPSCECLAVLHGHEGGVNGCTFAPDGKLLASASTDRTLRVWDVASGECLAVLSGHESKINGCAFAPDGRRLASASDDGTLRFWNVESNECIAILRGHQGAVNGCTFAPDGKYFASAAADRTLRIWDGSSGECLTVFRGHGSGVNGCAFAPDGKRLTSASTDRTLRVWDIDRDECVLLLRGHYDRVWGCSFSSDGRLIASSSNDRALRLWDAHTGEPLLVLPGYENSVRACAYDSVGERIVSGANDGTLRIWNALVGECLKVLRGHPGPVQSCCFSPDGRSVASASYDRTVRLWDAASGECLQILRGHEEGVRACAFHPHEAQILSASYDRTLRLWDVTSGACLSIFRGHEDRVLGCAFAPDGKNFVSVSNDRTLRLWDKETGKPVGILHGHDGPVQGCVFSRDGKHIISASYDHTLRVWSVASDTCLKVLRGHTDRVLGCSFSFDGRLAASASSDRTVRVWNVELGECVAVLRGHESGVRTCIFSSDGSTLASSGEDGTVRLWDVRTGLQTIFQINLLGAVDFVALTPQRDSVIQVGGDAWRYLGWLAKDANGRLTRYPAETYGPLREYLF